MINAIVGQRHILEISDDGGRAGTGYGALTIPSYSFCCDFAVLRRPILKLILILKSTR